MTYMPPPPPAKPRNNLRTILIVVGIVLVLCCGGAVAGGFFLFRTVSDAMGPAQASAKAYTDAIVAENYPAAYGHLCAKVRNEMSQAAFADAIKKTFDVESYSVTGTNVTTMNGRTTATVTLRATLSDGTTRTQIYPMVQEDGSWKVCQ
ncbi:Rv0361 family membrane protein [Catelliglobosispora koreensis]|uniref:Rv0361 family membrane protein n=1 Tax=Catelliglobosispora koreensis TaxID=129052 RepID=UPI0003776601|nr:NTF2-like N-terminal transpeptidase domain-containing protein [Catelliglobosispora koreensis]